MTEPVLYRQEGRIAIITLNRADTRNALSDEVVPALIAQLKRANADTGISCVILTGAGPSFSSGGNLKEIRAMTQEKNLSIDSQLVHRLHPADSPHHGQAHGAGDLRGQRPRHRRRLRPHP